MRYDRSYKQTDKQRLQLYKYIYITRSLVSRLRQEEMENRSSEIELYLF